MRKEMKKFLFLGSLEDQNLFFERAQKIGDFEFISVSGEKPHLFPKPIEDLRQALRILKKQQIVPQERVDVPEEGATLVQQVLSLKREIENCHEEMRLLSLEIVSLEPLGNFDLEELRKIAKETQQVVQFFFVRHDKELEDTNQNFPIYLNRVFDFDYYLHMGKEKFVHPLFTEIKVHNSLATVKKKREKVEKLSHQKEKELALLAVYIEFLQDYLLQELNKIHLLFAQGDVDYYLEGKLFAIEAWVPEHKLFSVQGLVSGLAIAVREVSIDKEDIVPTCLENHGVARIGQDLVEVYDIPSMTDHDPSPWIVWSFALFFGMIVSDAGYGLLFLLLSLYLWFAFPQLKGVKRRMLKLATILSCGSIVWGMLIASYFSIPLVPGHPLQRISLPYFLAQHKVAYEIKEGGGTYQEWVKDYPVVGQESSPAEIFLRATKVENGVTKYSFLDDLNNNILLELSLLVGIIHLTIAFLRNLYRSWMGIGWIATLWGGYLFFPKLMGATTLFNYLGIISPAMAAKLGEQLLYGGFGLALVLAIMQSKWVGLTAIFKSIEVFSDTLSYLRLYALGLAGMVLAATANEMGATYGYVLGGIIIVVGHTINISLCVGAGIIHGLRLHFLEWYHHCFEGDGKKWKPLRLLIKE